MLPTRSKASRFFAPLLLLLLCVFAAFVGLVLPVLPPRFSLTSVGFIIIIISASAILLLPDRKLVPYQLIFLIFSAAIVSRFLWPNYAYLPIPILPTKNPQRIIWLLAIAYWMYSLATNPELRSRLARRCSTSPIVNLVGLFFIWRIASMFFSEYPAAGFSKTSLELFEYLMAMLFVLTWVRGPEDAMRIGRWLLLATGVIVLIAIGEIISQRNIFATLVPIDSTNEEFIQAALESKLRGGSYRVQASFKHPLLLAQFICAMLPILWLTLRSDRSIGVRGATLCILVSLPLVLWATKTRTAIGVSALILIIGLLLLSFNAIRNRSRAGAKPLIAGIVLLVATALGAAVLAFAAQLAEGRTSEESRSSEGRVQMFERAIVSTGDAPMLGLGPSVGGFQAANVTSRGQVSLDSWWLVVLLESGIPALLLLLTMLAWGSWQALRLLSSAGDTRSRVQGAWGLCVLAFAITSSVLGTPHNLPLLFVALGVLVAMKDDGQAPLPLGAKARSR